MILKTPKGRLALAALGGLCLAAGFAAMPSSPSSASPSPASPLAAPRTTGLALMADPGAPLTQRANAEAASTPNRFLRGANGQAPVEHTPAAPFQGSYVLTCWQNGRKIIDGAPVEAPIAGRLANRDSAYFGQEQADAQILIMRGENLCLASRP